MPAARSERTSLVGSGVLPLRTVTTSSQNRATPGTGCGRCPMPGDSFENTEKKALTSPANLGPLPLVTEPIQALLDQLRDELDIDRTTSTHALLALSERWRNATPAELRGVLPSDRAAELAQTIDAYLFPTLFSPRGALAVAAAFRGKREELVAAWLLSAVHDPQVRFGPLLFATLDRRGKPRATLANVATARCMSASNLDALASVVGVPSPERLFDGSSPLANRFEALLWTHGAPGVQCGELGTVVFRRTSAWVSRRTSSLRHRVLLARLLELASDYPERDADASIRVELAPTLRQLVGHPEPLVWVPAARALGRFAAHWASARAVLNRLETSDNKSLRRRALTASLSMSGTEPLVVSRAADRVLEKWDDEWTAASVGPAIPYLVADHPDTWERLKRRVGRKKPPNSLAMSWGEGLVAHAARIAPSPLRQTDRELLERMRERAMDTKGAAVEVEFRRAAAAAALGLAPIAKHDLSLALEQRLDSDAAQKVVARWARAQAKLLADASGGERLYALERATRDLALQLPSLVLAAAGADAPPVLAKHVAFLENAVMAAVRGTHDERASGVRALGSLLDAGVFGPASWRSILELLNPLVDEVASRPSLAGRFEKPLSDLFARFLDHLVARGVPTDAAFPRFAGWMALFVRGPVNAWFTPAARAATTQGGPGATIVASAATALRRGIEDGRLSPDAAASLVDGLGLLGTPLGETAMELFAVPEDVGNEVTYDRVRDELGRWAFDPVAALGGQNQPGVVLEPRVQSPAHDFFARSVTESGPPFRREKGARLGAYELLERLGEQGGMSDVWLAQRAAKHGEDPQATRQRVLLKLPAQDMSEEDDLQVRAALELEARAVAEFHSPFVVDLIDFDFRGKVPFVAYRYLVGASLEAYLWERPMTVEEAKPVVRDVVEGLSAIHRRGMVHRDIKPGNIFLRFRNVDHRGEREFKFEPKRHRDPKAFPIAIAVILDFGIADVPWQTTSVARGTPGYIAPEQALGQPTTGAADVYALAATVCHMLTGEPFFADSPGPDQSIARAVVESPIDARVRGILAGRKKLLRLLDDATDLRPGARIDLEDFGAAFQAL